MNFLKFFFNKDKLDYLDTDSNTEFLVDISDSISEDYNSEDIPQNPGCIISDYYGTDCNFPHNIDFTNMSYYTGSTESRQYVGFYLGTRSGWSWGHTSCINKDIDFTNMPYHTGSTESKRYVGFCSSTGYKITSVESTMWGEFVSFGNLALPNITCVTGSEDFEDITGSEDSEDTTSTDGTESIDAKYTPIVNEVTPPYLFDGLTGRSNYNYYQTNTNISNMRRSKVFIKSRFSRNRQWCRPIVFWSLWLNVVFLGLSSTVFYGFKFSISYIPMFWIFFIFFIVMPVFISRLFRS